MQTRYRRERPYPLVPVIFCVLYSGGVTVTPGRYGRHFPGQDFHANFGILKIIFNLIDRIIREEEIRGRILVDGMYICRIIQSIVYLIG